MNKAMKVVRNILIMLSITIASVAGYAGVQYILTKTDEQIVTVGTTMIYEEGIELYIQSYDDYNLTYFDIDETSTDKHYITYIYSYAIMLDGYEMEVTSLTDDIIITNIVDNGTTIEITISLNQDKMFDEGQQLSITFQFDLIELPVGYSVDNPININTATQAELESIGLTPSEALATINGTPYSSMMDWAIAVGVLGFYERYEFEVNVGVIVFE